MGDQLQQVVSRPDQGGGRHRTYQERHFTEWDNRFWLGGHGG